MTVREKMKNKVKPINEYKFIQHGWTKDLVKSTEIKGLNLL